MARPRDRTAQAVADLKRQITGIMHGLEPAL